MMFLAKEVTFRGLNKEKYPLGFKTPKTLIWELE